MRKFAEEYSEIEFVQEVLAQITWYNNITLIEKVKDRSERNWYVTKIVENGWSRNLLLHQIESNLYTRQKSVDKTSNLMEKLPSPINKLAIEALKDPYIFDFITMREDTLYYFLVKDFKNLNENNHLRSQMVFSN